MGDVDIHWQVQQAKQRFSEVLRAAERDGPQYVTRHGRDVAVVLSVEDFDRLKASDEPKPSLLDHLMAFPKLDLTDEEHDALFERDRRVDAEREIPYVGPGWE